MTDWTPEDLWQAYIQLTEAEAAFRIHKSDLRIRPIWHQREDRVLAHILVCFLAYVLWKTLSQMVRAAGLGDEPRRVLDELGKINLVDVVLPTRAASTSAAAASPARPITKPSSSSGWGFASPDRKNREPNVVKTFGPRPPKTRHSRTTVELGLACGRQPKGCTPTKNLARWRFRHGCCFSV